MSSVPALIPFSAIDARIPDALKATNRWAPWVGVWSAKRKRFDKIPRRAANPQFGLSSATPEDWGSFDEAVNSFVKYETMLSGVGYCMTGQHGVVGIDLDDCLVGGQPEPWAAEIVRSLDSYCEVSPSGTGLRIMGLGSISRDWANNARGIEVYGGHEARFLTITGAHFAGTPEQLQKLDPLVLEDLRAQYGKQQNPNNVIELNPPELLDILVVPDVDKLNLPDKVKVFLLTGQRGDDEDRSGLLHACGVSLYACGLDDQTVFSLLVHNEHAMAIALDHRRQDVDRAVLYIWREHCQKAKPKAISAVATAEEFDLIALPTDAAEQPLPLFKRDKQGRIFATVENVTKAVRASNFCFISIRFDQFRDEIMHSPDGLTEWQPFTDADYVRLRITLENRGFKPIGRELIRDVVLLVAMENKFDTAIEWLTPIPWDGTPRIETFLTHYLGVQDTPYTRAVSRYMWTAMAGRVMAPGIKADAVPIFIGPQGAGKSRAVAALSPSPEFFAEISLHDKDDNLSRLMRGRLVAEIGELRGLHTREAEAIKAFITRTHEKWVPKYKEFATQFPRRLLMIGTSNKTEILDDETGNRRWLPLQIGSIDVAGIERDRDQLWAEGREVFELLGIQYQGVEALAVEAHVAHSITDTWSDAIDKWLREPDPLSGVIPAEQPFIRLIDVLKSALHFDEKNIKRADETRAAKVLRTLGYERRKVRDNGKTRWAFVPLAPQGERQGERNLPSDSSSVPLVPLLPS